MARSRLSSSAFGLLALAIGVASPMARAVPLTIEIDPVLQLQSTGQCRGCDLRGADLRGAHLIGVDLREADLRDAQLGDANLEGADLSGARMEGADLQRAVLSNAELAGTDLRRADLRDFFVAQPLGAVVRVELLHQCVRLLPADVAVQGTGETEG